MSCEGQAHTGCCGKRQQQQQQQQGRNGNCGSLEVGTGKLWEAGGLREKQQRPGGLGALKTLVTSRALVGPLRTCVGGL